MNQDSKNINQQLGTAKRFAKGEQETGQGIVELDVKGAAKEFQAKFGPKTKDNTSIAAETPKNPDPNAPGKIVDARP